MKKKSRFGWLRSAAGRVWKLPDVVLRFVVQWWSTRPWTSLLLGLAAIVFGLAFLAVEPLHNRTLPGEWARRYDKAGMAALRGGDLQAADVYFRRIAFLDEASPAACFGLALTAERQEDLPRARGWMLRIASETEPGYPPAHAWLAKDLMRQNQKTPFSPQVSRVLEHHLLQALRSPAYQLESRVNLTQLYIMRGETGKAIGQMERAAAERPALELDLARLYALAGRPVDARRVAAKAGEFFAARTQAEPDQPLHRQAWAASLVLQERHEEAVQVLTAGLKLPDPEPFRKALGAVYLHWLSASTTQEKPNAAQQLEFLDRVLQHDAANEQALTMLGKLAMGEEESTDQTVEMLKQVLARGAAPAVIHLALGTRALVQGDAETGLMHLELAQKQNARVPEVLNNLARGLIRKAEPDLERARQLAEAAQKMSKYPETYDTLGTILAKQGRPREAVAQLETALGVLPPRAEIHRKLGDLYEQLGEADLASKHRRLVQQIQSPPAQGKPK